MAWRLQWFEGFRVGELDDTRCEGLGAGVTVLDPEETDEGFKHSCFQYVPRFEDFLLEPDAHQCFVRASPFFLRQYLFCQLIDCCDVFETAFDHQLKTLCVSEHVQVFVPNSVDHQQQLSRYLPIYAGDISCE
jgi:hypothetical protein